MPSELVARCADFGVWLDIDLYNYAVEGEP